MPSFKDADLAAIKARYESNYALITNDPKIANDPVIIAALAKAKSSEAAFYAALENVEAKSNLLRRWARFGASAKPLWPLRRPTTNFAPLSRQLKLNRRVS